MSASTKDRSAKAALKRAARNEIILRLPTLPGTRQQLAELMAWHGIEEYAEAMTLLIANAHALGPAGSAQAMAVPRHEIEVSESVAREIAEEGRKEAKRLERTE